LRPRVSADQPSAGAGAVPEGGGAASAGGGVSRTGAEASGAAGAAWCSRRAPRIKTVASASVIAEDLSDATGAIRRREGAVGRLLRDDTLVVESEKLLTKARESLGWTPRTNFEQLIGIMVEADLERQERASGRRRGQGASR